MQKNKWKISNIVGKFYESETNQRKKHRENNKILDDRQNQKMRELKKRCKKK